MANIFLDVNCVYDVLYKRDLSYSAGLDSHNLALSALSIHISFYLAKKTMPHHWLEQFLSHFEVIPLDHTLLSKSIVGPTKDFEDNIQLNSAVEADSTVFCTKDKELLKMKSFEDIAIISPSELHKLAV